MTQCVYDALRREIKADSQPTRVGFSTILRGTLFPKLPSPTQKNLAVPLPGRTGEPEKRIPMSQQSSLLEDGFERIQSAFKSVEDEVQKAQKRFEDQSQKFSKDANKRIKGFQKELRKYPAVKRAESLSQDLNKQLQGRTKLVEKQIESGIESVLGTFQIASRGEIEKLDKKLSRISRRLKSLDKAMDSASAKAAPVKAAPVKAAPVKAAPVKAKASTSTDSNASTSTAAESAA